MQGVVKMNIEFIIVSVFCLIIGIFLTTLGFSRGVNDFLPNFLAGWGQFFIELVIALTLIDRFNKNQKNQDWAKVREIHHRMLKEHLVKFLDTFCKKFNYVEISKSLLYKKKGFNDLTPVVETLLKEISYIDAQDDITYKPFFIDFYNETLDEVKEIRSMSIPKIICRSNDQELINILSELDLCFIKYEDAIIKCKSKEKSNFNITRLVQLIEAINTVLVRLSIN